MDTPTSTPAAPATVIDKIDKIVQSPGVRDQILPPLEARVAAAINDLPPAKPGTPGWKTSEFWTLVVFFLLSFVTMLTGALPPKYAFLAQALSVGLYNISRGLTKHGTGN